VAGVLLQQGDWDAALEIAREYQLESKLVALLRITDPLLRAGRTATLSSLLSEVRKFAPLSPEADIIEAELDFRQGRYDRARRLAERAAARLDESDELRSQALFRSGQCAHLSEDIDPALELFRQARSAALTRSDASDALWGELVCALYAEHPSAKDLLSAFAALNEDTPDYHVRLATAHLTWNAVSGTGLDTVLAETVDVGDLANLADPMIRCSFLQAYAACCAINGKYDDAARSARSLQTEARAARLGFVRGIADLRLAAAHIGLRQYARAAARLDSVAAREPDDRFIVAIAAAARMRLAAIQRNNPPAAFLSVDLTKLANAPRGEYFASAALVHASRDDVETMRRFVDQALCASRSNETRAYAAAARAVSAVRGAEAESAIAAFSATLSETSAFDALVCAYRISPDVLPRLMEHDLPVQRVASVLRCAHDFQLAKQIGIKLGRSAAPGEAGLTSRESDVLELIEEGLSNKEIAERLFISQATAKVHVRHIFAKLGVRSRTEAALHAQASREA
jgi:ATP/maltotriose-dependent transcriptional regulator MalT